MGLVTSQQKLTLSIGEVKSTHLFLEEDSKKSYTPTKTVSWTPHNEKIAITMIYTAKPGDKIANHSQLTGKQTGYYELAA